jgi:putative nucleotidyltransferase with HDIG domain
MPDGLRGEEIPLAARILCLAQTIEVFHAKGGIKAARAMADHRRGRWFDPSLVDAFLRFCDDREFWAQLESPDGSQWEPPDFAIAADDARLDRIAEAFARVIDAKSPFTARHSQRVAEIADGIAASLDFDADDRRIMRRAALLHDIGKLAVSNRILDKPDMLSDEEFRVVQAHPVHTRSILKRAPCFAQLADLAANHHEKLDGSGYPRSLAADDLDLPMRVLAVADIYEALTADRPYRGPLPVEEALAIIDRDVPHRLDADVRDGLKIHLGRTPTITPERGMHSHAETWPLPPGRLSIAGSPTSERSRLGSLEASERAHNGHPAATTRAQARRPPARRPPSALR